MVRVMTVGLPLASRKRILPPLERSVSPLFTVRTVPEQATEHLVGFHLEPETFKCLGYGAFLFADKAGRYRRHLRTLGNHHVHAIAPLQLGLRLPETRK